MFSVHIDKKANELGELAYSFMKKRSQLCEPLCSGRKVITSAPSFAAILPSLKSTEWHRTVQGEAPVRVYNTLLELIEMLCALPYNEREAATLRALSILYKIKEESPHPPYC